METFEEVSEAFKEFEEGVIACAYSISGLSIRISERLNQRRIKVRTVKRTSIPTNMNLAGWNGILWRMSKNESIARS
jgi:hypothetical protein